MMLADDRRSWQLGPDATWRRTEEIQGRDGHVRHVRGAEGASASPTVDGRRCAAPAGRRCRLAGSPRLTRRRPAPRRDRAEVPGRRRGRRRRATWRPTSWPASVPRRRSAPTQLEDRYIDTADGALARAGFAARLRQTAKGTTVAVKSRSAASATGSVHRREELEGPADRTPDPRDWPPSDARSLILEQCGDAPLVELVTIRQLRRKRDPRARRRPRSS